MLLLAVVYSFYYKFFQVMEHSLTEWWGAGMVVCLEQGAALHMAQLMPLPLTVSCSSKIQIGLPFWYRLTWVVPEKGPLNGCVCVCVLWSIVQFLGNS